MMGVCGAALAPPSDSVVTVSRMIGSLEKLQSVDGEAILDVTEPDISSL
jgi:hypothetical protein